MPLREDLSALARFPQGFGSSTPLTDDSRASWRRLHARLVEHWTPASLLVRADNLGVVQLSLGVERFLQLERGATTKQLFDLVHPQFCAPLRVALAHATRASEPATATNVPWVVGGVEKSVTLRVIPGGKLAPGVLLVTFDDAGFGAQTLSHSHAELETVNELQAALDEVERSRLSLQSANLELTALNRELARYLEERSRAHDDLQNLMNVTSFAIVFLDHELRVMRFTAAAAELFHLEETDLGRPLSHPRDTLDYAELLDDAARAVSDGSRVERLVKHRENRSYLARVLPYRGQFDPSEGVVLTFVDVTEKQQAEAVVRSERARIELEKKLIDAQEQERGRISRELHDGVGQQLTALMLGLNQLEVAPHTEAQRAQRLRSLRGIAKQVGREIHELALALRPTALDDLGLLGALSAHLASWSTNTGISVDFQALGLEEAQLSRHVETTVYRVAQEALNNVTKHAAARSVSVTLDLSADRLLAIIEDDGVGFDDTSPAPTAGKRLGLAGMQQRAALVSGSLTVESSLGKGTTIILSIPTANQALGQ